MVRKYEVNGRAQQHSYWNSNGCAVVLVAREGGIKDTVRLDLQLEQFIDDLRFSAPVAERPEFSTQLREALWHLRSEREDER
jgi:hypothetical protein